MYIFATTAKQKQVLGSIVFVCIPTVMAKTAMSNFKVKGRGRNFLIFLKFTFEWRNRELGIWHVGDYGQLQKLY